MGTRIFLIACSLIAVSLVFSQGTEEQRKYVLPDDLTAIELMSQSNGIAGLSTHFHSEYLYYDLYMDAPDLMLHEMGYSLRFRKRIFPDSSVAYAFQLKSEMTLHTPIRMEVEETELDFYRVNDNGTWVPMTTVLDRIFDVYEHSDSIVGDPVYQHNVALLQDWIQYKADAPIAPFQKLKFAHPEVFTADKISTLQPVLCGRSVRMRGHVYIDANTEDEELRGLQINKIKMQDKPEFFTLNPLHNWVLESSMDYAVFESLISHQDRIHIREYEVENKYMDALKGTAILDRFTQGLISELGMITELASKYKQCMRSIEL